MTKANALTIITAALSAMLCTLSRQGSVGFPSSVTARQVPIRSADKFVGVGRGPSDQSYRSVRLRGATDEGYFPVLRHCRNLLS